MVVPSPAEIQYQHAHIHDDRSFNIVISHALCLPIAFVAVLLRFVSRRMVKASIQADDWLIVIALFFLAGEITGGLLCVRIGGGKHAILLTDPVQFGKLVLVTETMYGPGFAAVKLSILLLYRRLFPIRRFHNIIYCVSAFMVCHTLVGVLVAIFKCRPIEAAWEPFVKGDCVQLNTESIVGGILNIITDVVTLVLPLPLLWRLQISRSQKLQLTGIFLTGGVYIQSVLFISIYRIQNMVGLSLSDAPWSDVDACVWLVAEVCVGIVGACLPTLRPLFTRRERLHRESSPQELRQRYSYIADKPWGTETKPAQNPITAVKPTRSWNSDERPFVKTTISAAKRSRPRSGSGPPLVETTITTVNSPSSRDVSARPSIQLTTVPQAYMYS